MSIDVTDHGPVRWLTLNRPERKNAIPPAGWEELRNALEQFEESAARVLVITGAGGDFCSGADLGEDAGDLAHHVGRYRRMQTVSQAATALHRLTKPSLAAVDGVAVGAGMNLALGCDLAVASSRARFAEIFVQRGLTVDFAGTWLLPRRVGLLRAKELALTGRMVEAAEALRLGLVLEVVEADELRDRAEELASQLAAGAPLAQMFAKAALDRSFEMSFEEALAFEDQGQAICLGSEDAAEGIGAFLERRPPVFRGR